MIWTNGRSPPWLPGDGRLAGVARPRPVEAGLGLCGLAELQHGLGLSASHADSQPLVSPEL